MDFLRSVVDALLGKHTVCRENRTFCRDAVFTISKSPEVDLSFLQNKKTTFDLQKCKNFQIVQGFVKSFKIGGLKMIFTYSNNTMVFLLEYVLTVVVRPIYQNNHPQTQVMF